MNKSMLAGIGIGVAAALSVAAVAGLKVFDAPPQYAQVLSAVPIHDTIKTPRRVCRDVAVTHRRAVQDENRLAGSLLGAVAGGVLGHQVGGGRGRDVATVLGALGGGYAGNQIQGTMQQNDTYTTREQRCTTEYDKSRRLLGYDVTYRIGDRRGRVRMESDPGQQIPLDGNGQLIIGQDDRRA
ncbi:glycine zipper 2TM domain-containing protein [Edwardsiella ictaluri]|uniref:Surface antigen n=1 Tax=Edwardsiella ictaluri (strain 93-146) TaxID=634503 RepID=C5B8D4_EDWI9|nr:glycine zipper 2TM domain-containing protein [Edwardsiella ictaluri]ACR69504.1 surface antigen [Edwardsiella ictaluri 93-146]AVZ83478.1 glycine zipper 2TM domain-containing protein [Edwardsiella ictaluri]EKS7764058.1 glycine zipper 2TM domain-containing protein [Edwardsiella ictaluri]EKS7770882.1 glycine zipper 2TM domain-containing protein [Edwardsiella ictaluri]EKS7774026.1 glycine zipper 2TM domain-containing protein [Edwardsiella ictaluri]